MNSFFFFTFSIHLIIPISIHCIFVSLLCTLFENRTYPLLVLYIPPPFFFRPFVVGVIGSIERKPNKSLILRENEYLMPRYLPLIFLFRDSQHPSFIRDVSS